MRKILPTIVFVFFILSSTSRSFAGSAEDAEILPLAHVGRDVIWDMSKAYRETTATRQRICINGLWRWQPASEAVDEVPADGWGYFKVPGCWPGIRSYMQKDFQTVHTHPMWKDVNLRDITAAWYQREITVPAEWADRRIEICAEYVNSYAAVYVDGDKAGEILFPAGEVDVSDICRPGGKYVLSMLVVSLPLKAVMLSYSDTASVKTMRGTVARRGLCGDIFLSGGGCAHANQGNGGQGGQGGDDDAAVHAGSSVLCL